MPLPVLIKISEFTTAGDWDDGPHWAGPYQPRAGGWETKNGEKRHRWNPGERKWPLLNAECCPFHGWMVKITPDSLYVNSAEAEYWMLHMLNVYESLRKTSELASDRDKYLLSSTTGGHIGITLLVIWLELWSARAAGRKGLALYSRPISVCVYKH